MLLQVTNNFDDINTKHQLTDILTKGNFTRDEWNNLLHLFNISQFRPTSCTKNFMLQNGEENTRSKEEERVVSKSRPPAMNLSSFIGTSSSTASSPIGSNSPVRFV